MARASGLCGRLYHDNFSDEGFSVIRQMCPSCFAMIELASSAAGTSAACPKCSKEFPVPSNYTPTVLSEPNIQEPKPVNDPTPAVPPIPTTDAKPTPPPGLVIPTDAPRAAASTPEETTSGSYGTVRSVTLSPSVLEWLPVACFTLILLLTFFSWVGLYPGGFSTYTQSAWQAFFGTFRTDHISEEVLKLEAPLKTSISQNLMLMFPYLVALLFATVLAWADRFVTAAHITQLPPQAKIIEKIWPFRFSILTGLAILTLVLLLLQISAGFGLESAVAKHIGADFNEKIAASDNSSTKQKLHIEMGTKLAQYQLTGTTYLYLALLAHVAVVLAAAAKAWLHRRGTKPLPRIQLQY
ncbi:MAG: hypothetical protein ACRC8S_21045 [Fimbriiglobus sp.]